ncbi:hypothetical protein, partial [Gluconobacter cerinus]|uniref:hypothetical protein n=1 Tax=Gluconobacter cerinus TaxID=38307 RepID=UPI001B8AA596
PICSKRRAKATPGAINQHAKTLKSGARRINQRFFDLSRLSPSQRMEEIGQLHKIVILGFLKK